MCRDAIVFSSRYICMRVEVLFQRSWTSDCLDVLLATPGRSVKWVTLLTGISQQITKYKFSTSKKVSPQRTSVFVSFCGNHGPGHTRILHVRFNRWISSYTNPTSRLIRQAGLTMLLSSRRDSRRFEVSSIAWISSVFETAAKMACIYAKSCESVITGARCPIEWKRAFFISCFKASAWISHFGNSFWATLSRVCRTIWHGFHNEHKQQKQSEIMAFCRLSKASDLPIHFKCWWHSQAAKWRTLRSPLSILQMKNGIAHCRYSSFLGKTCSVKFGVLDKPKEVDLQPRSRVCLSVELLVPKASFILQAPSSLGGRWSPVKTYAKK